MDRRSFVVGSLAAAGSAVAATGGALAQAPQSAQIKLLVGFPPGGSTDVLARVIAQEAGKRLGRDIIVLNKPGASGAVAANEVASSPPDGLTLGITPSATMTLSHVFQGIKPDLLERTEPLLQVGFQSIGFVVKTDSPFKTYGDFVKAAKAEPTKIAIGMPGAGTTTDMLLRAAFQQDGLEVNIVPFRGDVPTTQAVLGGHVQAAGVSAGGFAQHIEAGTLRLLVAMEAERLPVAPAAPTFKELGYDFAGNAIQYMYAPKGLPAAERTRLIDVLTAVISEPVYVDIARKNVLFTPTRRTGDELARYLLEDRARNTSLATRLGLAKSKTE